jgi:ATP-dependent RNA helicase DDX49/DBP8
MTLNEVGFENVALHAMIRQKERLAALAQFRSSIIRILIATDVASRGMYHFVFINMCHIPGSHSSDYSHVSQSDVCA